MKKIKSKLKILIPVILAITLIIGIPVSASADTISFKPTFATQQYNYLNVENSFTNFLEKQYTYGGTYNPLILACETSHSWVRAIAAVRWEFGKTLPAGTEITIQCAGWHNRSYSLNEKRMYVALTSPASQANWQTFLGERTVLPFNNNEYVQTSNGVYRGYLCTGKYVLPADTDYIYLVWDITLSGTRNGGTYVGISCSSISYQGTHISPAESEIYSTPDTSAIDEYESQESAVMEGINDGLLDSKNLFTNFQVTFAPFIQGTMFMSNVISLIITGNEHINSILVISLSLGMFGLLTNILMQSIKNPRDHIDKKNDQKGSKK